VGGLIVDPGGVTLAMEGFEFKTPMVSVQSKNGSGTVA
jgi:hypothetical protein